MDTIIQLLRNGLCCIKDLNLYSDTRLYDTAHTALYYKFPPPLNETTPLELLIALCQLYAVISLIIAGFTILVHESLPQLKLYRKLYAHWRKTSTLKDENLEDAKVKSYVTQHFEKQISLAQRNIVCGVCVLSTGIAFFWLFLGTLHVTQTGFLGGMPGLMHALVVTEVALLILLYYMLLDTTEKLSIASKVKSGRYKDEVEWYAPDWQPFWKTQSCLVFLKSRNTTELDKELEKETQFIRKTMQQMDKDDWTTQVSPYVENLANQSKREAFCNFIYFILNLLAFLGYGLCVVCYYYPNSKDMQNLKFGFETQDADWWGNFVGDFCWTIEPIIIAFAPLWIYSSSRKEKSTDKSKME